MVYVNSPTFDGVTELGMTDSPIRITVRYNHKEKKVDDYGDQVPAEVFTNLADAMIQMTLINFDMDVLRNCLRETVAGPTQFSEGVMGPVGQPMGAAKDSLVVGNRYIRLAIESSLDELPWRFPSCYIANQMEFPISAQATGVNIVWRALPYSLPYPKSFGSEVRAVNAVLYDHELEEDV